MENRTKQRNIVNNMRWLFNDIAPKASWSMRLWKPNRCCMRRKLELGSYYLRMVMEYNTMFKPVVSIHSGTPESGYDPATDNLRLVIGTMTLNCAPATVTTVHQAMVNLWEQAASGMQYDCQMELEDDTLFFYNYDATLSTITLTATGGSDTVQDITSTANDIIESWNQLTLEEIYLIPKEMVRLREIKCRCQDLLS